MVAGKSTATVGIIYSWDEGVLFACANAVRL